MNILNIHGYKGTAHNAAYSALCGLEENIVSPWIDYDDEPPAAVLDRLVDICSDGTTDLLVGTSLGGFFASVIAARTHIPLLLVNPCLQPQAVIPLCGYSGDLSFFEEISKELYDLDTERVRCIIGGRDEIIGDHRSTKELLGMERIIIVSDGLHSGATLDLEKYFPEMINSLIGFADK